MSSGQSLSRTLMKLPLSVLVKGTTIPSNPVEDLGIDISKPIVYALPFRSNVDLLTFQRYALEQGLPDPLTPLEINGQPFGRFVFTSSRPTLIQNDHDAPSESVDLFTKLLGLHNSDSDLDVQVLPVSVLWGRKPGKEENQKPYLESLNGPQKQKHYCFQGETVSCDLALWFRCVQWQIATVPTKKSLTN